MLRTMMKCTLVCFTFIVSNSPCFAYQIAPVGSSFESRLTNESDSHLASVARRLGVIIKGPVHEEITQVAASCPADMADIEDDEACASADVPFANQFIIYGVRWNDVPPFKLNDGQGNCRFDGAASHLGERCNTEQTIRFSTQPACWICIFKDAEKKARINRITKCEPTKKGVIHGNLMTRSHFGDLQFLHAMADAKNVEAEITRQKMIDWAEFVWKVILKEVRIDTKLRDVRVPTIQEHFGCTEWTVADLYILGRNDVKSGLIHHVDKIAFGSLLHMIQDSFAAGHVARQPYQANALCSGLGISQIPKIVEFHNYGSQDGTKHDHFDSRDALTDEVRNQGTSHAIDASRKLFSLFEERASWAEVKPHIECILETAPQTRKSSPGERFAQVGK